MTVHTGVTPSHAGGVLVTGGAGFIGSHVVDELLRRNYAVTVLDDLSTGLRGQVPDDPRVRFVHGDVADREVVRDALTACRRVVHLAAIASVQRSVEDPVGTHRINYAATLGLLEEARAADVEHVSYASSAAVYGDAQTVPASEDGPVDPQTPYAIDKLMGETALGYYASSSTLSTAALRFFNVYGPRQRADSPYSGVISLFVRRLLEGEPIVVYGDGAQTRDFVFVEDVARALVDVTVRSRRPLHGVMNVGSGASVSVRQLIDMLEHCVGVRGERVTAAAREGEVRHSCASVERLREDLGWAPSTPLPVGLRHCVEAIAPRRAAAFEPRDLSAFAD